MGRSTSGSATFAVPDLLSQPSLPHYSHATDTSVSVLPLMCSVCVNLSHGIHPFSGNRFDAGPVCLASIVHAFNYQVTVLRDGVKLALRTGRSRKAERGILDNVSLPWDQQVAVMFQILSALVLDVSAEAESLVKIRGIPPNLLLPFEPRGHIDHAGSECHCLSSDRTGRTFKRCQLIILLVTVSCLRYYRYRM